MAQTGGEHGASQHRDPSGVWTGREGVGDALLATPWGAGSLGGPWAQRAASDPFAPSGEPGSGRHSPPTGRAATFESLCTNLPISNSKYSWKVCKAAAVTPRWRLGSRGLGQARGLPGLTQPWWGGSCWFPVHFSPLEPLSREVAAISAQGFDCVTPAGV